MGAGVDPEPAPPVPLRALAPDVDLDGFDCGEPSLNDRLKKHARPAEGRSARSYVVCRSGRVDAWHCLATGGIERAGLPRKLRHGRPHPVPVFVLGRLAVDLACQGRGLGADLVADCFRRCLAAASIIGATALVVHPLSDRSVPFYRNLGFGPLGGGDAAMFVLVETISDSLPPG